MVFISCLTLHDNLQATLTDTHSRASAFLDPGVVGCISEQSINGCRKIYVLTDPELPVSRKSVTDLADGIAAVAQSPDNDDSVPQLLRDYPRFGDAILTRARSELQSLESMCDLFEQASIHCVSLKSLTGADALLPRLVEIAEIDTWLSGVPAAHMASLTTNKPDTSKDLLNLSGAVAQTCAAELLEGWMSIYAIDANWTKPSADLAIPGLELAITTVLSLKAMSSDSSTSLLCSAVQFCLDFLRSHDNLSMTELADGDHDVGLRLMMLANFSPIHAWRESMSMEANNIEVIKSRHRSWVMINDNIKLVEELFAKHLGAIIAKVVSDRNVEPTLKMNDAFAKAREFVRMEKSSDNADEYTAARSAVASLDAEVYIQTLLSSALDRTTNLKVEYIRRYIKLSTLCAVALGMNEIPTACDEFTALNHETLAWATFLDSSVRGSWTLMECTTFLPKLHDGKVLGVFAAEIHSKVLNSWAGDLESVCADLQAKLPPKSVIENAQLLTSVDQQNILFKNEHRDAIKPAIKELGLKLATIKNAQKDGIIIPKAIRSLYKTANNLKQTARQIVLVDWAVDLLLRDKQTTKEGMLAQCSSISKMVDDMQCELPSYLQLLIVKMKTAGEASDQPADDQAPAQPANDAAIADQPAGERCSDQPADDQDVANAES
jgi:hypothetical protein